MKGVGGVVAVGGRIGQRPDHLVELDHRARPAMGEDKRERTLVRRADVDELYVETSISVTNIGRAFNFASPFRQSLVRAPIADASLELRQLHALGLICDGLPIGPPRLELLA